MMAQLPAEQTFEFTVALTSRAVRFLAVEIVVLGLMRPATPVTLDRPRWELALWGFGGVTELVAAAALDEAGCVT